VLTWLCRSHHALLPSDGKRYTSMMQMRNFKRFGHNHFGFFYKRIIEIDEGGIRYKNKDYTWNDIKKISRYESIASSLFFSMYGYPLCIVKLKDGKKIYLQGRIMQEEGQNREFNLLFATKAYCRLVSYIENKMKENV
jgi:hypothetical protein